MAFSLVFCSTEANTIIYVSLCILRSFFVKMQRNFAQCTTFLSPKCPYVALFVYICVSRRNANQFRSLNEDFYKGTGAYLASPV